MNKTITTTRLAIIFLIAVITTSLFIQGTTQQTVTFTTTKDTINSVWISMWGNGPYDTGNSVWKEGQYIYTLGSTRRLTESKSWHSDFLLIKWDMNGNIIWNKTWSGPGSDYGYSLWSDGSYLYGLGSTYNHLNGVDFSLVKWDMNGNVVWSSTWGGNNRDRGYYLYGKDNYLYTIGDTNFQVVNGNITSRTDIALVKWDMNGNIIWSRTWGGPGYDHGYSIWINNNHLYLLGVLDINSILIKLDMDGNIMWNRTLGNGYQGWMQSIWGNDDYLYTLGGMTNSSNTGDFLLIKWDMDGNIIWNRTWGGSGNDLGRSLWSDGSYLYGLGETASYGSGSYDFALVKWDMDGNIIWSRTWGGGYQDWGYSIQGDDSYLYLLGSSNRQDPSPNFDLVLMKIDVNIPLIIHPNNINYQEGSTGHNINWITTDSDPDHYSVTKNNLLIESDVWTSGNPIIINVDGLPPGSYNYTITMWDTSSNTASDTVIVQVIASATNTTSTDTTNTDITTSTDTTSATSTDTTSATSTDTTSATSTDTTSATSTDIVASNKMKWDFESSGSWFIKSSLTIILSTASLVVIAILIARKHFKEY